MLTFTALVLFGITVTSAYKGIPDSEDKAFVFEKDEYSCLSQKTLPKNFTFVHIWAGKPVLYIHAEDAVCPQPFLFSLSTKADNFQWSARLNETHPEYFIDRISCTDIRGTSPYLIADYEPVNFRCSQFRNKGYSFTNFEYHLTTNNSCNFWFCMGHMEQFKRQPHYPAFAFPVNRANYYLAGDPLPKELKATDTGLAIDVLKASGQVFTIHKTSKRPIQTIEVITPKLCSGMVVSMDFDGMCTISVDLRTNQATYYVNGINIHVGIRPIESVITFTYTTAYLYTFQPMGFYPLTDCKFDATFVDKAEYNLKVWYDKTRASSSCDMIKLRFSDVAAIKRWATTTTSAMTTTTPTETETQATELPASTASTEMWAVVAVVCFASLVVVIVAVLLFIRWLKMQ